MLQWEHRERKSSMFRDFALHAKSLLATGRFCRAQKAAPAKEILRSLGAFEKHESSGVVLEVLAGSVGSFAKKF